MPDISPPPLKRRRVDPEPQEVSPLQAAKPSDTDNGGEHASTSVTTTPAATNADVIRVYSWNINGIQPFIQRPITSFFQSSSSKSITATAAESPSPTEADPTTASASLRGFLKRHDWPELLFLQEVKINPADEATQRAVERAVRRPPTSASSSSSTSEQCLPEHLEPDYRAFFCLPSDAYNARGFGRKVYGVCSIGRADFLESWGVTVRTVDWDREGRVQIVETEARGRQCPKLSIWNVYAVNGTENAYRDPKSGEVVGTRHDRKLEVHRLMLEECKRLEERGYAVVLAGDMNVARSAIDGFPTLRTSPLQHVRNRTDFNSKFFDDEKGLQAIDTFRHVHGNKRGYTYHPRGRPFKGSWRRRLIGVQVTIALSMLRSAFPDSYKTRSAQERMTV